MISMISYDFIRFHMFTLFHMISYSFKPDKPEKPEKISAPECAYSPSHPARTIAQSFRLPGVLSLPLFIYIYIYVCTERPHACMSMHLCIDDRCIYLSIHPGVCRSNYRARDKVVVNIKYKLINKGFPQKTENLNSHDLKLGANLVYLQI